MSDVPSIVGYLEIDPDSGSLGTSPPDLKTIGDHTILEWALHGLSNLDPLEQMVLVLTGEGGKQIEELAGNFGVDVIRKPRSNHTGKKDRIISSRKWSIGNWRGGIGQTTVFCESGSSELMKYVVEEYNADLLMEVPRGSPFVPHSMLEDFVAVMRDHSNYSFQTAAVPPGLHYVLRRQSFLARQVEYDLSIRELLLPEPGAYCPDPVDRDHFFEVPRPVRRCNIRLLCDVDRSHQFVQSLFDQHGDEVFYERPETIVDAAERKITEWCAERPREIHVSFSGNDSESLDEKQWKSIWSEVSKGDDTVVTVSAQASRTTEKAISTARIAKQEGVFGVHVEVPEKCITEDHWTEVIDISPDIFTLDCTRTLDQREKEEIAEHGGGLGTLDLEQRLQKRSFDLPLIVLSYRKDKENWFREEAFFDFWNELVDQIVIRPRTNPDGSATEQTLGPLLPPNRSFCRKLRDTLFLRPDGTIPYCKPASSTGQCLGQLPDDRIEDVWQHEDRTRLMTAHLNGDFQQYELCPDCTRWTTP